MTSLSRLYGIRETRAYPGTWIVRHGNGGWDDVSGGWNVVVKQIEDEAAIRLRHRRIAIRIVRHPGKTEVRVFDATKTDRNPSSVVDHVTCWNMGDVRNVEDFLDDVRGVVDFLSAESGEGPDSIAMRMLHYAPVGKKAWINDSSRRMEDPAGAFDHDSPLWEV